MQRREFIAALSGMAIVWPFVAGAQQVMPAIGLLSGASSRDYAPMIAAFRIALGEAGFVEGKNVKIEYVWADEQYDRLPALAADLVRRQMQVIVAATTPAALALKPATTTIPVVFAIGGDPVRTGLVASLNRPGGNLTGAAHINVDTAAKPLELLHELVPTKKTLGLMTNPTNPLRKSVEAEVRRAAEALGVQLNIVHASTDEDIDTVFKQAASALVGGLVIGTDPLFTSRIEMLGRLSLQLKVPTIYQYRDFVTAGGAMSYGGDINNSYYRAGVYAGRILKGEKAADLPVQLSTKVELFINLKTAKALGIDPPMALLARAEEVIE